MIVYVKNKKNLQINYNNKLILQGHWIESQYKKSIMFTYISTKLENKNLKLPFIIASKKIQIFRNKSNKRNVRPRP